MQEFTARVTAAIPRTPSTLSVRLERPAGFDYRAGQWGVLTIGEGLTRTLSLSSSPSEPFLEFTKRLTPSGFCQALEKLVPGDELGVKAPGGSFTYPPGLEKAAFLTGGIGITPFRSILRHQADRGERPDRVFLYFNRNPQEIPFRAELEEMSAADPTFRLVHVLEEPPPGWEGWSGRISREILERELPDLASRTVFVCGPPPMIAAAEKLLSELSFPPERLRQESFAGYGS